MNVNGILQLFIAKSIDNSELRLYIIDIQNNFNNEVNTMKKISYKTLCNMLNVTDKDIKARIEEASKQSEPVYESEKYGFDWIAKVVNPGCKLTATELGHLWKSLNWAKKSQYPKYFELKSIAACLFMYRVEELNEPFTK